MSRLSCSFHSLQMSLLSISDETLLLVFTIHQNGFIIIGEIGKCG